MIQDKIVEKAFDNIVPIAIIGGIALAVIYYFALKGARAVVDTTAGVLTGDNALTAGTQYQGAGVTGTLGAATNQVLGGVPQAIGESIADKVFSWFNPEPTTADIYYGLLFPDGSRHAVHNTDIDQNGIFTRDGVKYKIGYNQANQMIAVKA